MPTQVWIVEFNNRDDGDTHVGLHATEELAYDDACSSIEDDVSNNWDDESSEYEDIMERFSNRSSIRDSKRIVSLYNNYSSNNDQNVSYQVYAGNVNGSIDAPKPSDGPVTFIPDAPGGNGCNCKKCGNHSQYAGPNYTDGSFVCTGCRLWEKVLS